MRTKQVYSAEQLMHVFNSQSQTSGRTSSGNVFFSDNLIYSYGSHYLMGAIHGNVILINSRGYSVTTAKHTSYLRQATSNRIRIEVPLPDAPKSSVNLEALQDSVLDAIESILSAKPRVGRFAATDNTSYDLDSLTSAIDTLNAYSKAFKVKNDLAVPSDFIDHLREILKATHIKSCELKAIRDARPQSEVDAEKAKRLARRDAELAAKQAIENAKLQVARDAWLKNESNSYPRSYGDPTRLRVNGDLVETSHHASVPLTDAIALMRAIESDKAKQGDKVGVFEFTKVNNEQEIVIGCHRIDIDEARRVLNKYL